MMMRAIPGPWVLTLLVLGCVPGGSVFCQAPATPATPATAGKDAADKPPEWVAIENGTIIPVAGPVLRNGTLVIKDGKIELLGQGIAVPGGAKRIDAAGKFVCPGFVAVVSNGALGVSALQARDSAKDRFNPFTDSMLMCLAAGITTAHQGQGGRGGMAGLFRGGPSAVFAGTPKGVVGGAVAKLTYGAVEGYELREPAGVYMNWSTRSRSEVIETREALEKAAAYGKERQAWLGDLIAGKKDIKEPKTDDVTAALAACMRGEQVLFMSADDQAALRGCLELMDEFKIPMVLCGATEGWILPADIGRRPASVIMTPRGSGGRGLRPHRQPYIDADHGWSLTMAHRLSEAGVPWATMTLGTSVVTSLFAGRDLTSLSLEAAFAVRGGASNDEALRSITLTAAQILKVDDRVGSLERGKDADVLILDREPLDYRALVDMVLVNGKVVYDRREVPFWDHIRTDRSQGLSDWAPWGPWPPLVRDGGSAGK